MPSESPATATDDLHILFLLAGGDAQIKFLTVYVE